MNYIEQLNSFFDLLYTKPLSTSAICLYVILFHLNNKCGWQKEFTVANMTIQGLSGMSRNQLHKARLELIQNGYVNYKKGNGNQCGKYLLVRLDTQIGTQIGTQTDTQLDTQTGTQTDTQKQHNVGTLNKLNKTKQNETKVKKVSKKGEPTFDDLINAYTQNETLRSELKEHLKTRKAKKAALTNRAIELELGELDKLSDNEDTKIDIVRQSILRGWIGFFPLKEEQKSYKPNQTNNTQSSGNPFKDLLMQYERGEQNEQKRIYADFSIVESSVPDDV